MKKFFSSEIIYSFCTRSSYIMYSTLPQKMLIMECHDLLMVTRNETHTESSVQKSQHSSYDITETDLRVCCDTTIDTSFHSTQNRHTCIVHHFDLHRGLRYVSTTTHSSLFSVVGKTRESFDHAERSLSFCVVQDTKRTRR
jgi:hypothetical protein